MYVYIYYILLYIIIWYYYYYYLLGRIRYPTACLDSDPRPLLIDDGLMCIGRYVDISMYSMHNVIHLAGLTDVSAMFSSYLLARASSSSSSSSSTSSPLCRARFTLIMA